MDPAEEQRWNAAALAGGVRLPAIRIWTYGRAGVVLGRAQRPDDALLRRAREAGVGVHERLTGGGAVLVGPWLLAASVVLPPGHRLVAPSIPASYGWFGEAHASVLRELGIEPRVVTRPVDPGDLGWSCFAGLSHGEVEVGGRKLVGLSQARRRGGALFSSGLLLGQTPWALLCDVMGQPRAAAQRLEQLSTSCAALLGPVPVEPAARALLAVLERSIVGAG
jgi:lipoate---protein ligase